jgi:hypothetical protein
VTAGGAVRHVALDPARGNLPGVRADQTDGRAHRVSRLTGRAPATRVKIHGSETASPSLDFAGTNPYSDARDSALARRVPAGTLSYLRA